MKAKKLQVSCNENYKLVPFIWERQPKKIMGMCQTQSRVYCYLTLRVKQVRQWRGKMDVERRVLRKNMEVNEKDVKRNSKRER